MTEKHCSPEPAITLAMDLQRHLASSIQIKRISYSMYIRHPGVMTTRLIGAIIMVHGDNDGLVLPPKVAPTQVMVIPIQMQKDGVLDKANEVRERLGKSLPCKTGRFR